jgi:hypothetical protein
MGPMLATYVRNSGGTASSSMTGGAVQNVIRQRLGMIMASDPELEVRWEVIHDDWGIIEVSKDSEVIGFEFVESHQSWGTHERLTMYSTTVAAGHYVIVAVPEDSYIIMMTRLAMLSPPRPLLYCYDRKGKIKNPLCS